MISWVIHRLNLMMISRILTMFNPFYCLACLYMKTDWYAFSSFSFSAQGCPLNRLYFRPVPDSDRVRRLHLSNLGYPKCSWAHCLPRTRRLHPLWCYKQTQQGPIYYWWDMSLIKEKQEITFLLKYYLNLERQLRKLVVSNFHHIN